MLIKNVQLLSALYSIALVSNTKPTPHAQTTQQKIPKHPKIYRWTSGNVTAQIVTSIYFPLFLKCLAIAFKYAII